jgi:hypothetical protein
MNALTIVRRGIRETDALIARYEELAANDPKTPSLLLNLKSLRRMRQRLEADLDALLVEARAEARQQVTA